MFENFEHWLPAKKSRPPDKSAYWKFIFLISQPNICCGYSKEPTGWCGSFEHPNTCLNSWLRIRCTNYPPYLDLRKRPRKQHRPRSELFWRNRLIRVFPVYYSDKNFVNSSPDNQNLFENRKRGVLKSLEHLLFLYWEVVSVILYYVHYLLIPQILEVEGHIYLWLICWLS